MLYEQYLKKIFTLQLHNFSNFIYHPINKHSLEYQVYKR